MSIRDKQGRRHVTPEWKERVVRLILRDLPIKAVAVGAGLAPTGPAASRWAHALGFRLMYVSDEERRHLMRRRAAR